MKKKNTATIEDLLANHAIVKEAHRRAISIAGFDKAGDLAQDTLLLMWEEATREDEDHDKLVIKNLDHFWQLFTTNAKRIADRNRIRISNRGDVPLEDLSDAAASYTPDYYEALESLTDDQKAIAQYKIAGMSYKDIAATTSTRLATIMKTFKQIRTEITLQLMIETGEINIMTLAEIVEKKAAMLPAGEETVIDRRKGLNNFQLKAIERQLESHAEDFGCTIARSYHHEPVIEKDGVKTEQPDAYDFFLLVKPELSTALNA